MLRGLVLFLPHPHRQIRLDKAVDGAVEDSLGVVGFVFGAGVFDEGMGVEHIVAELRPPASGLTSLHMGLSGGLLPVLRLSESCAQRSKHDHPVL